MITHPLSEHPMNKHQYLGAPGSSNHVRVALPAPGSGDKAVVEIGGVNVANYVLGLELAADGKGNRDLVLRIPFDELQLEGCTKLSVPEWAHGVLVALGWTPPAVTS